MKTANYDFKELLNYYGIDEITADTRPDFGSIHGSVVPWDFHPTGWSMVEWRKWHGKLLSKYGKDEAANIWISYWNQQIGVLGNSPSEDDIKYFAQYGINVGKNVLAVVSKEVGAAYDKGKEVLGKEVDAAENLIDGIGSFFKSSKWILPAAIIVVLIIAAIVAYNMSKNSKIN